MLAEIYNRASSGTYGSQTAGIAWQAKDVYHSLALASGSSYLHRHRPDQHLRPHTSAACTSGCKRQLRGQLAARQGVELLHQLHQVMSLQEGRPRLARAAGGARQHRLRHVARYARRAVQRPHQAAHYGSVGVGVTAPPQGVKDRVCRQQGGGVGTAVRSASSRAGVAVYCTAGVAVYCTAGVAVYCTARVAVYCTVTAAANTDYVTYH
jgi:hypothetical protein